MPKTYIILLRGVMPVGKNKVPMAALRQELVQADFTNVRTYIQSGNALLTSDLSAPDIEQKIHDLIAKAFGGDIAVVARTPAQFEKILDENPFQSKEPSSVYFTLLQDMPSRARIAELESVSCPPDEFKLIGQTVYLHCPDRYGKTKLNNNFFERKLGVAATTRNSNTMRKLLGMTIDLA